MKKLNFLLIVTLLILSIGCKKKELDKIYQYYSMEYDEEKDQTTVRASFSKDYYNGTYHILNRPHSLTLNGVPMEHDTYDTIGTYKAVFNGNLSTAIFKFKTVKGMEFINTLTAASPIANCDTNYIDNDADSKWYWTGNLLGEDEYIYLAFRSVAGPVNNLISLTGGTNTNYYSLSKSFLSPLLDGPADVYITKYKSINTGDFTAGGGCLKSSFRAKLSQIEIH